MFEIIRLPEIVVAYNFDVKWRNVKTDFTNASTDTSTDKRSEEDYRLVHNVSSAKHDIGLRWSPVFQQKHITVFQGVKKASANVQLFRDQASEV